MSNGGLLLKGIDVEPALREKCQVAWFKLAEFIDRGEKERALAIYKLLMHTVEQKAYAKYLEGDLLLFFKDPAAITSYEAAAQLYYADHNIAQTVSVYERLVRLRIDCREYLLRLVALYQELGHPTRTFVGVCQLIEPLVRARQIDSARQVIVDVSMFVAKSDCGRLYHTLLRALLQTQFKDFDFMAMIARSAFVCFEASDELRQELLRMVREFDESLAHRICATL